MPWQQSKYGEKIPFQELMQIDAMLAQKVMGGKASDNMYSYTRKQNQYGDTVFRNPKGQGGGNNWNNQQQSTLQAVTNPSLQQFQPKQDDLTVKATYLRPLQGLKEVIHVDTIEELNDKLDEGYEIIPELKTSEMQFFDRDQQRLGGIFMGRFKSDDDEEY